MNNSTFVSSDLPVEIWADWLEEQGQDTSTLRAWITMGLVTSEYNDSHAVHYTKDNNYGNGYGYVNGYGYELGDGYIYGYCDGRSYRDSYGDGFNYDYNK